MFVVKVGTGDVDQLRSLLLNSGNHFGMAMTGRRDGYSGSKIEEFIPIHILNAHPAATFCDHGVGAGVARGYIAIVAGDDRTGFRTGQRTGNFRTVLGKNGAAHLTILLHNASLLSRRSTKASQSTAGRSEAGQSFGGGKASRRRRD